MHNIHLICPKIQAKYNLNTPISVFSYYIHNTLQYTLEVKVVPQWFD